ncbi:hypothetical protein HYU14_01125 [Candidatus Woesearchaeota archaeon]|nr:hypothetical protein [Candidatus Woesearchaeota archaeon]
MEKFEQLQAEASKRLSIADHMLAVTYPMVKDPKLLVSVLDNMFLAMTHSLESLLHYERGFKRVPPFRDTFASKMHAFRTKCAGRFSLDPKYLSLMQDVYEIASQHKRSQVEFVKDDVLAICSENYKTQTTISAAKIKEYVAAAKKFIAEISLIIRKQQEKFDQEVKGKHGRSL